MTTPVDTQPVRADQKISTVLKEHPELLDVLVAQSPHFSKLKNPLMRRTFARMATVSQASGVAGIPVEDLLRALNGALSVEYEPASYAPPVGAPVVGAILGGAPPGSISSDEPPAWLATARVVAEVEARDMQQKGQDPFFVIQDTARGVGLREAFRLRNTFQPFPLYSVLGAKGFSHWAEQLGPEDWLITFYRERQVAAEVDADDTHPHGATRAPADPVPAVVRPAVEVEALFASDAPPAEDAVAAVVTILPEDLTPPTPMVKVLEGLAPLRAGDLLLVHHLRLPPHLTAKLEEQGHRYRIWDLGPDRKEILIEKAAG